MSRSLDFCKAVGTSPLQSHAERVWGNAFELPNTEAVFDEYLHGTRNFYDERGLDVSITFDDNSDFDYITADRSVNDGTLYFIVESIHRCVQKVCTARSYNKNIGRPDVGDHIEYVVGNFVILIEDDGDFVPYDRPWMSTRTTVMLPVKMMKG